jgi:hypothetical protein
MSSVEPGLDRHEWESELATLEDGLTDDPAGTLPAFADLVERMLEERGLSPDDPVADDGIDPEVLLSFRAGREIADLVDSEETVDPGDVAAAIANLRAVFDHIVAERGAP